VTSCRETPSCGQRAESKARAWSWAQEEQRPNSASCVQARVDHGNGAEKIAWTVGTETTSTRAQKAERAEELRRRRLGNSGHGVWALEKDRGSRERGAVKENRAGARACRGARGPDEIRAERRLRPWMELSATRRAGDQGTATTMAEQRTWARRMKRNEGRREETARA
jgi:hypothetical protein